MTIFTDAGNYERAAWTGGDAPPPNWPLTEDLAGQYVYAFFLEEQIRECGGLALWACAGTSVDDRLDIFKNRARLDAWRTLNP
jgi:hypothetical protein